MDGPGPADLIVSAYYDPEQIGYNRGRVDVFANSFATNGVPATPVPGLDFAGPRPNPAVNEVNLDLVLDHAVPVRITVYDLAGHEVARPIRDEWLVGRVTRASQTRRPPGRLYYVSAKLGDRD